jgi:hypothetical protein
MLAFYFEDPETMLLGDAMVPFWVLLTMLAIGALKRTENT